MQEVYRGSVQTWHCDMMGHLNVQFYLARVTEGLNAFGWHILGIDQREKLGLVAKDHHVRFLRELRPGAPFIVRLGILASTHDTLRVYQELTNVLTGEPAATFVGDVQCVHLPTHETCTFSDEMLKKAQTFQTELPEYAAPRGLTLTEPRSTPTLEEAEQFNLLPIYQGLVTPEDVDQHGHMATHLFMGKVSEAIPVLHAQTHKQDNSDSQHGGAALEYRLIYRNFPRINDWLTVRSGLRQLGKKTVTWVHWMFDQSTGECVATAEAIAISLDLEQRKAMDMPPVVRANLQKFLNPALSV